MECSERNSKKNGWDYCTMAPDKLFGVYIGCCCKEHDINYSKGDPTPVTRIVADVVLRRCVRRKFIEAGKLLWLSKFVSNSYFWAVVKFGNYFWKTWILNGNKKYN